MKKIIVIICFSLIYITSWPSVAGVDNIRNKPTIESINAVKWWRDSAERIAIYREIFLMADHSIKQQILKDHLKPHTWGVIVDVDETILDNSKWNREHVSKQSQKSWDEFAAEGISIRTPGAKELLTSIHQLGGYANLVTNRPEYLRSVTEKNLKQEGLYFDQILLKPNDSRNWYEDKNFRFQAIIKGKNPSHLPAQTIIAWLGDNIQDFPKLKQNMMSQQNSEGFAYDKFGVMYFALPNPMYGSWENNTFH